MNRIESAPNDGLPSAAEHGSPGVPKPGGSTLGSACPPLYPTSMLCLRARGVSARSKLARPSFRLNRLSVSPWPISTGMSSFRPCATCQAGPFFAKNAVSSSPACPVGQPPLVIEVRNACWTAGGSLLPPTAKSSDSQSARGTSCGASECFRSYQVISGASASNRVRPRSRSSVNAPSNWYPPPYDPPIAPSTGSPGLSLRTQSRLVTRSTIRTTSWPSKSGFCTCATPVLSPCARWSKLSTPNPASSQAWNEAAVLVRVPPQPWLCRIIGTAADALAPAGLNSV